MKDLYDLMKQVQTDLWEDGSNMCVTVELWKYGRGDEELSFKIWDGQKTVLDTTSPEIFRQFSALKQIDQKVSLVINAKDI